jgi:serine/threonine protein kinase
MASAAGLFDQILEGIKAAHAANVVHRDLKPENILLAAGADGQVRAHILDFGLAKLTQAVAADSQSPTGVEPMTTPGAVMGTFGYMSPEQLTGGIVDERSDLFSTGVMAAEALTGRKPFTGRTYHELLTQILQGTFHFPGDSPEARRLDRVLQKCLAKDRQGRFSSAAEMQLELIPAIRNCPPFLVTPQKAVEPDADTAIL